jgi:hypothetical protein
LIRCEAVDVRNLAQGADGQFLSLLFGGLRRDESGFLGRRVLREVVMREGFLVGVLNGLVPE